MKKKHSYKPQIKFSRIISNNLFLLKLIHKSSPLLVPLSIAVTVCGTLTGIIINVFLLRYALNNLDTGKSFSHIASVILLWLAVCITMMGFSTLFNNLYYDIQKADVKRDIQHMVYKKAVSVELVCYENPDYYNDFVKAIDECETRIDSMVSTFKDLTYLIVSFSANFTLIVSIDPMLLLFVLIPLLAIPFQSKANKVRYEREMHIKEENRRKDYSRRTFYLADYAKEMRLSDMPQLMVNRFRESGEHIIFIIKKYGFSLAALGYITSICNELLTTLGATLYAVWQTFGTGQMGYGDCIVIVNSISDIAYALTDSSSTLLQFQENALYIENLRRFLDYQPTLVDGRKELPSSGDLLLDNVSFRYAGAAEDTLHHLSMRFGRNEKIAIVGHNGAGKTTLVKLLLRLYDPQGTIRYGGVDIREFPLDAYRSMFSAVMQDFHIFALSTADNVILGKRHPDDELLISNALEKSGLKPKVDSFENGLNTVMTREFDDNGVLLSGGEQQKLAISHVYAKENRFVILDEPSSALDPIAEHEMYQRMQKACENCGMIFISHRLSSAVMADRIYLMENGTVAETGTHEELIAKNGKYAEMFRRQSKNYTEV